MQQPGALAPGAAAIPPPTAPALPILASVLGQLQAAIEQLRHVITGIGSPGAANTPALDAVAGASVPRTGAAAAGTTYAPSSGVAPASLIPSSGSSAGATPAVVAPAASKFRGRTAGAGSFKLATFNVLGASHTDPGGNKRGYRSGVARVDGAVRTLRRHAVDVAGMQEFQPPQQRRFRELAPEYGVYGHADNAVVWRTERFRKVRTTSLAIPYFNGRTKQMPAVLLEDRTTGARTWVFNVHNPADTKDHPNQGAFRAEALRREQAFVRKLEARGTPVYLVGDFNAHDPAQQAMRDVGMSASTKVGDDTHVDWLFGGAGTRFLDSTTDEATKRERISDHPIVVARAALG